MNIKSVRWYCYDSKSEAQAAFSLLRQSALGGPGKVELRFNAKVPSGWWVVTYNILAGTSHAMNRVYHIPQVHDADSWFPYEGEYKLTVNTAASSVIESFDVEANVAGLLKAKQELADELYLCRPDVRCREEADKRLQNMRQGHQDQGANHHRHIETNRSPKPSSASSSLYLRPNQQESPPINVPSGARVKRKDATTFELTDKSLSALRKLNLPLGTLYDLKKLQRQKYTNKQEFMLAVERIVGKERMDRYKFQILKHARWPYNISVLGVLVRAFFIGFFGLGGPIGLLILVITSFGYSKYDWVYGGGFELGITRAFYVAIRLSIVSTIVAGAYELYRRLKHSGF